MLKTVFRTIPLFALASIMVWAQAVSGTLSGRVTAVGGTGVPNAAVTITNADTNVSQRVLTGPDGAFSVAGLAPGTYRVDVETAGFKRTSQQNIQLSATAPATVNLTLEAGNMQETVEIKGTAPNVQTTNGEVSLGITDRVVRELPILNRNFQQVVELNTGTTPPNPAFNIAVDPAQNRYFSNNGQDPFINLWHLDGIDNHEPFRNTAIRVQPIESIQQMNIVSGAHSVEKGYAGGAWVNNVTRAGTNPWHGSLFEFHSNNELRSRPFFNQDPNPKPRFTFNQFGGTLGGSVIRDRMFFFGSYEGTYNRGQNTVLSTVPTADMAAGNFSAIPGVQLFNPATGSAAGVGRVAFANNTIPANLINPFAAGVAAQLPQPNLPGFTNNYIANARYENDAQKFDGRLDYRFSDRTSTFLRYGYSNLHSIDDSVLGAVGANNRDRLLAHNAALNVTHSFTPSLITEFRMGYNRYNQKLNFPGNGLTNVTIPGMLNLGPLTPMHGIDNNFNWVWNWSYRSSIHNVKFGTDIRRYRSDGFYNTDMLFGSAGGAIFGPGATLSPAVGGFGPYSGFANSWAGFLLGSPSASGVTAFTETPSIRQSWYSGYLSDTLNVMQRLSFDIGVRYDVFSPLQPRRAGGAMFFDPAYGTLNFAGVGDINMRGGRSYDLNNVSPRISFAFSPTSKTAIRGGYTINYFQTPYMFSGWMPGMVASASGVPGTFGVASGTFTGTTPAAPAFTGTPVNGVLAPNVPLNVMANDAETPYIQTFHLQLQQELASALVLNVGYVGTLGRQLPYVQELNVGAPGTGLAGLPFASFGRTASTSYYTTGLTNNYNSLQVNLTKRFAHGLAFQGAYTWSKALGYTSGPEGRLLDPLNRQANYGPLDYDRQHMLTISHVWELPFGAGTNHLNEGVVGHIVGNWQINGIFTWATGTPLTIGVDPLFLNSPNAFVAANVNGPVNVSDSQRLGQSLWNASAFSAPAAGSSGNLGRGAVRAPGFRNYDMSLFRSFPIRDRYKLEFRGEVYNISNTPRFMNSPVTTTLGSPFFGQPSTLQGAFGRQFNLAARILF